MKLNKVVNQIKTGTYGLGIVSSILHTGNLVEFITKTGDLGIKADGFDNIQTIAFFNYKTGLQTNFKTGKSAITFLKKISK